MKWNSNKVAADLEKIDLVTAVHIQEPGGDVDTDNIVIEVEGVENILYVCGFNPEDDPANQSDCDVPMIQLNDGQDSRIGLYSNEENLALAYVRVREYFRNQDPEVDVVGSMDDYF